MAQGIPTDPLLSSQWHLGLGAWAINVQDVWLDYTGNGVTVAVLDDGFDYLHPDLSGPYNTSLDYDYGNFDTDAFYVTSQDTHGTAVMGIIGADDNGQGGVGVAFDTELIGYRLDFSSFTLTTLASALNNAANNADIMNNSWGFTQIFSDNFSNSVWSGVSSALINMVDNGRGGLGTITLFSGGNDRAIGGNSNYHNMSNSPYTIAVAALDQDGTIATTIGSSGNPFEYSSPGANLLVSAPGSQIQTTDVRGATGYSSGDYTNVFGGTSAASPIVSGVVALMLEANPNLGYRDVQEILAFSARKNDPTDAGWQTNGAGLHFNHDYGFGLV
ncbi:MAG: S8 family serine peptidase, partial [Pseudomonadota bacterium]